MDGDQQEPSADPALDAVWGAYCRWDDASIARKKRLDGSRGVIFTLLVGAAVAGVLASQYKQLHWVAGVAAALSAGAALLGHGTAGPAVERLWLVARAAAETLKSEAFKYSAGADPYNQVDRQERLLATVGAVEGDNIAGIAAAPPRASRALPRGALGQTDYLRARVDDQLNWYEAKAGFYNRRASLWHRLSLAEGLGAAMIGGLAASAPGMQFLGAWVAVGGTLSGIFAAYVAGARFTYLAQSYELTARRLRHLRTGWDLVPSDQRDAKWNKFVLQCESTISAEREQWMKEWQRQIAAAAQLVPENSGASTSPGA